MRFWAGSARVRTASCLRFATKSARSISWSKGFEQSQRMKSFDFYKTKPIPEEFESWAGEQSSEAESRYGDLAALA